MVQIKIAGLLLVMTMTTSGCVSLFKSGGPDINGADDLVEYLRSEGVSMLYHGPTSNWIFTTPGQEFTVTTGGLLQIYEYNSVASAVLDYSLIDDERDLRRGPKIYYRKKLIVVYFGHDSRMENVLSGVLGPQVS